MIIQVLLVVATLAVGWFALRQDGGGFHLAARRVVGAAVLLAGVLAVLWPDALTRVANVVGVGRGTDLLLYGLVVVFGLVSASLYGKVRDLEAHLTTLVREHALANGTPPSPHATDGADGAGARG